MLLNFHSRLTRVGKCDPESVFLADRDYSRQSRGTNQFMPPGRTIVLRDNAGLVVFGWVWQQYRDDGQKGYNCSIFRNNPAAAVRKSFLRPKVVGKCFRAAGYKLRLNKNGKPHTTKEGLWLFIKRSANRERGEG